MWKSLSLKQSFVPATSCTNSVSFDFLRLVAATKFCSRDKDFHKNLDSSTHEMICRSNVLLQLFAGPVHKEWFVMATFCWNLSPSVFEPLTQSKKGKKIKSGGEVGSVHRLGRSIRAKERSGEVAVSRLGLTVIFYF